MLQSLSLLTALAWRNLWRNKRRTLVILFAMVLGIWAMIITAAFMRGISIQILDDTVNNLTAHIQVHHIQYLDDPVIDHSFVADTPELIQSLKHSDITHWASRIRVPAVISSERDSSGLELLGIDPESEKEMTFLYDSIVQGHYFENKDDKGIIIGLKLAEKLETRLGKRVVVMSQSKNNKIADKGFRIIGIYDTPTQSMETGYLFMTKSSAANLLSANGLSSEIAIITRSLEHVPVVLGSIQKSNPELDIQAWDTLQPFSKLMTEMYTDFQYIWHLIVFLAMSFGIINTLLMAVFERTREFGLFQALGLKPSFILLQVWVEAVILLAIALVVGNLVSWLTVLSTGNGIDVSAFAQGMEMAQLSNIIPFIIVQADLFLANAIVMILGLLTSFYPAWRASRLVPADAITRI